MSSFKKNKRVFDTEMYYNCRKINYHTLVNALGLWVDTNSCKYIVSTPPTPVYLIEAIGVQMVYVHENTDIQRSAI